MTGICAGAAISTFEVKFVLFVAAYFRHCCSALYSCGLEGTSKRLQLLGFFSLRHLRILFGSGLCRIRGLGLENGTYGKEKIGKER